MKVQLKVLKGSHAGKCIPVAGPRFVIGRGEDCQLRPNSEAVSRSHCALIMAGSRMTVRDLGSRNGTYVNGEKITGDRELVGGDKLVIGPLEFEIVVTDSPETPTSRPEVSARGNRDDNTGSHWDDDTVGQWLDEADAAERAERMSDPDTRVFKFDETERVAVDQAAAKGKEPREKKPPAKLPEKKQADNSKDSQEAAAKMLKRLFNRG